MVAVSVACGLAGALGAVVFRLLIRSVQALFFEGVPASRQSWRRGSSRKRVIPSRLPEASGPAGGS